MQIQIHLRNMLFINYAVPPARLRAFVPAKLPLDRFDEQAFLSAVTFINADVKASVLPIPSSNFEQINYRAYVKVEDECAVYFFDMKVNSRVVATGSNFFGLPMSYEEIHFSTSNVNSEEADADRANDLIERILAVTSASEEGLTIEAVIGKPSPDESAALDADFSRFITERPVGYVKTPGGGILTIPAEHELLNARPVKVKQARARLFERLGLLSAEESAKPHSVLYVPEAVFNTAPPALWLP